MKEGEGLLRVAISYPDLYEIGMCNAAVRIIYRDLNRLEGVACERVFAPAPDLEAVLREDGASLFSLETGRPLRSFDVVAFSIGFELTLTNLFAILDLGGIPLRAAERGGGDPIVIAGGPAVSNPAPLGAFLDGVFIGEAEGWLTSMFTRLALMKRAGAERQTLLDELHGDPSVWFAGRTEPVRRAFWRGFRDGCRDRGVPGAEPARGAGPRDRGDHARMPERLPVLPRRILLPTLPAQGSRRDPP